MVSEYYAEMLREDQRKEDCPFCGGTGQLTMPPQQAWSEGRGTYIQDDYEVPCDCQRRIVDLDDGDGNRQDR